MFKTLIASALLSLAAAGAAHAEDPFLGTPENLRPFNGNGADHLQPDTNSAVAVQTFGLSNPDVDYDRDGGKFVTSPRISEQSWDGAR